MDSIEKNGLAERAVGKQVTNEAGTPLAVSGERQLWSSEVVLDAEVESKSHCMSVMNLSFRPYEERDWLQLVAAFDRFWADLVALDKSGRMQHPPEYGEVYCRHLLQKLQDTDGILLWALIDDELAGLGAANVEGQTELSRIETGAHKEGRIMELFVEAQHRSKGIGRALMAMLEEHLVACGCDVLKVEVFAPNAGAHRLYRELGYSDWAVDLFKRV